MPAVIIVENTNILKQRLEKILNKMDLTQIAAFSKGVISFDNFYQNNSQNVKLAFINADQFRDSIDKIMKTIHANEDPVKTIFLTEKTNHADLASFYYMGVDDILLVPFSEEHIMKKIVNHLHKDNQKNNRFVKRNVTRSKKTLEWYADYEIGVKEIDRDHREIIEHFETLYQLMKQGKGHEYYLEMVKFLDHYVEHHFDQEEKLMMKIGYKEYENHKGIHDEFKKQVKNLMSEYNETNVTSAELVKLNLFIRNWLSNHILVEDKKIGEYVM